MCLPCCDATRLDGAKSPVTDTDAKFETEPTVAVTEPLPGEEPAVKTVEEPVAGETVPGAFVVHDAFETGTGLPYASAPVAAKVCVPPTVTVAVAGETVMVASAA